MPKLERKFKAEGRGTARGRLATFGPNILVGIGPLLRLDDDGQIAAPPSFRTGTALIDTGADHIYIDEQFALACNLKEIDRTIAIGAHASHEAPTFFGRIRIAEMNIEKDLRMIGMNLRAPGHDAQTVIVGRYFLNTFDIVFTYNARDGSFSLESPDRVAA